ncbi:MAG: NAD(P)-dependent oxidoreductase [Paracoccaceae bacterium]
MREDADILVTGPLRGWRDAPEVRPDANRRLRWIQTVSSGIDSFPHWLLQGRLVSTGRGLTASRIAEYVMAAILRRQKPLEATAVRGGNWNEMPLASVAGQRLGIVGFGAIGQEIVRRASAFDMEICVVRRSPAVQESGDVRFCAGIDDLLPWADHLVLALPSTPESRNILSRERLMTARPGLHVINISRGDLLDQDGLLAAIGAGQVGYATLDVTTPEPLPAGHPMLDHPDILITPHNAWSGDDWQAAFQARVLRGLDAIARGANPEYLVDPSRGY